MVKTPDRPPLTIVGPAVTGMSPPRPLGLHGLSLWNGVLSEFDIHDRAGFELLAQAAALLDRAESLAEQIATDGVIIRGRNGMRSHPAIRDETQCRTACVRVLEKLGVTQETLRPGPGRPPNAWRG